jgi:hypothetical protein
VKRLPPVLGALAAALLVLVGSPADAATATIAPGGAPVTVTIATAFEDATVTFTGVAGQRVSLRMTSVTIGPSTCCSTRVSLRKPDGTTLVAPVYVGTNGGFVDATTLPVAGTYSIFVDPQGASTGSMTLTLYNVPADATATIVPGGAAVTATTTTPGQNARVTFTGTAGRRVSLSVGPACCATRVSILNPNGSTLAGPSLLGTAGGFVDVKTLSTSGTYAIVVDQQSWATGSVTLTLHDVPADVTGATSPGGPPVSFATTVPGQNARITFPGSAGGRVSMKLDTACCATRISVLKPDGTTLVAPVAIGTTGGFVDVATLPVTGTYSIVVDPQAAAAGTMTLTLYAVPPDVTGTIAPDGVPVTVTTSTPGQNGRVTFAATAGQRISLKIGPSCCSTRISILNPGGTTFVSPVTFWTTGGFVDTKTVPVSGTYTIVVDPQGVATGAVTLTLYDVPADLTGTITAGGASVTLTTTTPGQNARLTFAGAAGQRVSLKVVTSCCATRISILNPDASTLVPATSLSSGGGFVDTKILPTTGTYTIVIDPQNGVAGAMTFTLYDVPPDVTGTIAVDGPAVTVATTTPGQNGRVTFAGSAGDGISLTTGPFNCCSVKLTVVRPDGGTLAGPTSFNPDGGTMYMRLPMSGLYAIVVDPLAGATGNVNLRLKVDNTAPSAPLLTLAEASPESHVVGGSFYYRPGGAGAGFTVTATTSDGGSGIQKMRFPGLSGGFSPTTFLDDLVPPYARTYTWTGSATYSSSANAVTAYDKVGNTASAFFAVTPDGLPPTTTDSTAAIGSAWRNTTQTVVLTPTDALSGPGATYATSDGSTPTTSSPLGTSVTLAAEGIWTVKYFSVDNVGNVETVRTAGTAIRIDKTKPSSATLDPLSNVIRNGQVLTGSGADALSGLASIAYYFCAGGSCTPSTLVGSSSSGPGYAVTWSSQPADGTYQVLARASDAAGNTLDSAKRTVTIDNTAPNTTITAAPSNPTNATGASFSFGATESGSTFQCRLDGGAFASCTSPAAYTGLAPGAHTFEVHATDPAGNTDPTPAAFTWTVDTTPPDTTITATPPDPSAATASFSFASSETGSTFQCRLDGASFSSCTNPKAYSGLASGVHTFDVRATDRAGNTDPTPAGFAWTVDASAPDTLITATPAHPTNATSADFEFASSESGSSFECALDGAAFSPCTSPTSYAGLANGTHTFEVRARDTVGNSDPTPASFTWTVDTSPPETAINAAPANPSAATSASFSFSATQGGSTFECRLDAGFFGACTSPKAYSSLADGTHTFEVRATDPAGNTDPTPAAFTWTVDTAPPDTTITATPPDPSAASGSLSFVSSETGSTFQCRLDAGSFGACTSPKAYSGLADGTHTFEVRATDPAGNTDATPAAHSWTVDTTAPSTSLTSGPPDPTNSTSATFVFSASEPGSTFDCALDGGSFGACTSAKTYSGLADGTHTFEVRATDSAGNTDPTAASFTWTVDTTAPSTFVTSGPADPANSTNATFVFSASEPGSTFDCALDGDAYAPCTSPNGYPGLAEGGHTFQVRATDSAGNTDPTAASFTWTVDTTAPPAPVLESPPDGSVDADGEITVSGTAQPATTVELFDSGASIGTTSADGDGAWAKTATGLADGGHVFTATATDAAGNTSPASAARTVTVDTDPPQTIMGTSPIGSTASTSAALSFSADEAGSTFECSLDGEPFAPCSSPTSRFGLGEGPHTFEVRATDSAGNTDPTPAARSWTVDTTAPAPPVLTTPADGSVSASSSMTVSGTAEADSIVEVLDEAASKGVTRANADGTWSKPLTGVADGPHSYTATATDAAGNTSAPSTAVTVTVDTATPQTTIASGPADPTAATGGDFAFSASESGSAFQCALDGASFSPCTSPKTYVGLAEGVHTFEVRATDTAGNTDPTPAAFTWTVDTTAPETAIDSGPADPSAAADADFSFSVGESGATFECALDGAAFAACASPQSYTGLAAGAHTFEVRATDVAGNTDPTPAIYSWTVT